jgi:hypothetical protein
MVTRAAPSATSPSVRTPTGFECISRFLGAGVIVKGEGNRVHGLTTAAAIWVTAALGILCGGRTAASGASLP